MWWLLACSSGNPSPWTGSAPSDTAVVEVTAALDQAMDKIRRKDPEARASVYAAYHRFEALEPSLRGKVPPTEVVSLEYAFGQVADAVADPVRAESVAAGLKTRLQALAPPPRN